MAEPSDTATNESVKAVCAQPGGSATSKKVAMRSAKARRAGMWLSGQWPTTITPMTPRATLRRGDKTGGGEGRGGGMRYCVCRVRVTKAG